MLNKIKTLVVVLVCMIVCGSIAAVVETVDVASKEAVVAEVKAEIAAVDEEEAYIVERLAVGYEADDIVASVKIVDLSSLYRFLYGMSIDYAVSEGIEDGSIVYCINHAGNSDYCMARYNTENNLVDFLTVEDLEEEVSSDKFLIIQLAIFTISMGIMAIMVLFTIIDNKAEEAEFEAYLAKKETARKEAERKLKVENTREAIKTIKEASVVIDNMVSNDMVSIDSYYLKELYQDLETLYTEVVYNEVELESIINVQVDMKNVIEYPHFMF